MANKVLSIEVGSEITKVAEVDFKGKQPKVYSMFHFATPQDVIAEDGKVLASEIFASILNGKLREQGISSKKVVFVVDSARIANRTILIPFMKENRINDFLNTNASDYFPVDLNHYQLTHEVLGTVEENGEKKISLSILAVPIDLIGAYEQLASVCGLTLVGLDHMGNAIKKMMVKELSDEIKVSMKIEEGNSIITIVENDQIQLQRTVNYGLAEQIALVSGSGLFGDKLDAEQAINVLSSNELVYESFEAATADADSADKMVNLRTDITDELHVLVGSISRIIDYYTSRNTDKKLEKIYLCGIGAAVKGLPELLSNELGLDIVALDNTAELVSTKGIVSPVCAGEFLACIGAGFDPISLTVSEKKDKSGGTAVESAGTGSSDSMVLPIIVFGICVIASIGIIAYSLVTNMILKSTQKVLNDEIAKVVYIEDVVAEYETAVANKMWADAVKQASESENDNLVAFMEELEEKMPSEIHVLSLSATETSININIEVKSKSAVADIVDQLRTFDTIIVGTVSTISDEIDDAGVQTVNFSVDCTYANAAAPVNETTPEPAADDVTLN